MNSLPNLRCATVHQARILSFLKTIDELLTKDHAKECFGLISEVEDELVTSDSQLAQKTIPYFKSTMNI